jgi:hypothetical protein
VNAIRVSNHVYNTKEELDAFLVALKQILTWVSFSSLQQLYLRPPAHETERWKQ